ncbi:hypothetical protein [Photobacterium leiognathi]|uniref:hypothetical protein n=1 Tax=Photobacterium leiognathi TaxID=553611 RepID=UPI002981480A|nr:hypothetical protein [Photobacterium leiognathi]
MINIYRQSGMTTLLITSMLLIVALLLSLASYKNLIYQVKRTQNEVLARQAHWLAEGGLECGFSYIKDIGDISAAKASFGNCESLLNLSEVDISTNNVMRSSFSELAYKKVIKKVKAKRKTSSGALKSSADMYINGSTLFETVDPGEITPDGWECVAIRYKNIFNARAGGTNYGVNITKPYDDFYNQGSDCQTNNKTNIATNGPFLNDFIHDENLEPFYDLFNEHRDNWEKVKTDLNFFVISNTDIIDGRKVVSSCGTIIANEIENNSNRRLWIDGSCEIKSSEISNLNEAISNNSTPVLLLVHDGIFAINTGSDGVYINGMLYHLNTNFIPSESFWSNFDANSHFGNYSLFSGIEKGKTVYHQRGSLIFSGGQVIDSPGDIAYFDQSLRFKYNRDKIDSVIDPHYEFVWQKGSWNDL